MLDVIRKEVWNNNSVRGFYAQNMFLYVREESGAYEQLKELMKYNNPAMYDIVHPEVWEQINQFKPVKLMDSLHDNKFVSWIYY